jgi:undecaprenyl-diphosphatase
MEVIQAVILGIVQGLTEFLPVSSSGHLVLFQHLFGMKEPELFFDICVHVGTLTAVILFFRKDLRDMAVSAARLSVLFFKKEISYHDLWKDPNTKFVILIIIGSFPTGIIGLLFKDIAEKMFSSVFIVGCTLIITGTFLWLTRGINKKSSDIKDFSAAQALIIGIVQGIAITPGISRSGSTIAAGLFLGLNREIAARYSFLLSIPAIMGAAILGLKDAGIHSLDTAILIGAVTAGIVGYLALTLLVYIVKKGQLYLFSPYCWLIGIIALFAGM